MALLLLLSASVQGLWAGNLRSDTLEVLFRVGQSDIDLSYADNAQRIDNFMKKVRADFATVPSELIQLTIEAGASPEGLPGLNKRLGEERGQALKNIIKQRFGRDMNVQVINRGPRWGELAKMVEASDEEWKNQVMRILGQPEADNDYEIDPRERQLRALNNGRVWVQLQAKYLPKLRSTGLAAMAEIPEPVVRKDTIVILDTVIYMPEACPVYEPPVYYSKNPALKTNMLLWAVGAPNLQFELPLGKKNRWSVEAEVFWPWITWDENRHAEQGGNVGIEFRYWLGNRMKHHTLDGWHIGLAAATGYYDIEWKKSDGYQGEYTNTYFNIGWQKRFGRTRRWGFDASVGLGWLHTKYRHYKGSSTYPVGHEEDRDNHLMWQDDLNKHHRYSQYRNFFGATHANIGFSYFLGKQKYRTRYVTAAELEAEAEMARQQKQAKAVARQQERDMKAQARQAEIEAREAAKAQKQALKANEDAAKAAEKEAAERAKAEAKAAKEAEKAAEEQAKEAAKAAKKAAKETAEAVDEDAEKAAKEAAKQAEKEAKAAAKAAEEQAKAAEKEAAERAKAEAKAAKEAEKAAEEQAKEAAKAAKKAAKETAETVDKEAEKAAKEAAKQAEKAAKEAEKAAEEQTKAAEQAAKEQAKAAEKAAKEQAKAAEQAAKEAEKAAAEKVKAEAAAAKEAEKAAAAAAKEAEKAAKEQAKAAEQAAKEAEKAAAAAAKEAEKAAKEQAKAAQQAAKEAEKAAAEKVKAEAAAAKEAEKAAAAAAKEAEKAAKEQAKAAEQAAKEAEKAAAAEAKAAAKAAKEAEKAAKSNAK